MNIHRKTEAVSREQVLFPLWCRIAMSWLINSGEGGSSKPIIIKSMEKRTLYTWKWESWGNENLPIVESRICGQRDEDQVDNKWNSNWRCNTMNSRSMLLLITSDHEINAMLDVALYWLINLACIWLVRQYNLGEPIEAKEFPHPW